MDILVDTGVLLRLTIPSDPNHADARRAVRVIKATGNYLVAMTQNAAEFWNVCIRPSTARGGYGLSIDETARKLQLIERLVEIRLGSQDFGNGSGWLSLIPSPSPTAVNTG